MEEFASWFCLNADRTFMVQPDRDPEFYFGRAELAQDIIRKLERGILLNKVPKLVLFGAYGAGKTHTLYHIKWYLENHESHTFAVRYVETPPDLSKKSRYTTLHQTMMDKVGMDTVRRLLETFINNNLGPELDQRLTEYFYEDGDLVNIVRVLAQGGPQKLIAWKWLRGEQLQSTQLQSIGVARNPELKDLIDVLLVVGRLFYDYEQTRLVFLVDELEQLEYVTGEEISTWETAFRKLADQDNGYVGLIFASRGTAGDELPSPLKHRAFTTRITENNFVVIPYLEDVDDVASFVRDLVGHLVDRECAREKLEQMGIDSPLDLFPFTPEALDLINQFIHDDPTRALPRELLFSLNECGAAAVGASPVISEEIVQSVLF